VAKTATQSVKSTDVVCRYGGEEFAVVLPNTRIDSARISAEKIRESIAGQKINFEGKSLQVTASIGVAEIASDENAARIIRHSDEAVYAAKNAGRNRTFWHDGQTCLELGAKSSAENEPLPKVAPNETQVGSGLSSSLPGRELFTGELQRRVSESHRFGVSLSVLFVRIKDFASLENNYGIAVGNFLLDSVAQFIRGSLRDMDLLGRLEEGDFVVMLPGSSEREAKLVGSRVQSSISNCTIPLGGQKVRLNVLQGVTDVYPDDDAEKMIQRSEEVMLDNFAKQQRAVPV
jgi:diguanylate cyclase (GGDEF)-like protein